MQQGRSRKKLKLQDITYYSNKRQHPFSYSRSPTPKNINNGTPSKKQRIFTQIFNSLNPPSPTYCCHGHKNEKNSQQPSLQNCSQPENSLHINCHSNITKKKGIMRQIISNRIQQYKKEHKNRYLRKTIEQTRQQTKQKQLRELQEYPTINQESKKLYEKCRSKNNLSPQVLVRFAQYQRNKTLKKIQKKIQVYYKERNKIPKAQEVVSPEKLGDLENAKKLINQFGESVRKFVVKVQKNQYSSKQSQREREGQRVRERQIQRQRQRQRQKQREREREREKSLVLRQRKRECQIDKEKGRDTFYQRQKIGERYKIVEKQKERYEQRERFIQKERYEQRAIYIERERDEEREELQQIYDSFQ